MNPNQSRIEEALEKALQKPDEEREAYLSEVCGEDVDLRRELESLINAGLVADQFMAEAETFPMNDPSEDVGSFIGPYRLLQKIGEGGFGNVYMAEQDKPVRRRVALKVIKPGMDSKHVIARFEAERQALAMMDHTNIARVFDGGTTDTGRPYFVMELVKGMPITQYCDEQKLSTEERLRLFMDVCSAVQHAHQKGVIHRDIKPSNVLVTLYDGKPVPKVIDFGIAKAIDQRLTEKTLFTRFEQMIGTPDFMSPEQAEMSGLDIDTRSDIYSLGVLLYVLLTGQKPFEWGKSGLDEIRRRIKEEEPPKPSTRLSSMTQEQLTTAARYRSSDIGSLSAEVKGDLDWVVMKAIEKDRTRRYETANAFRLDLDRFLKSDPVTAVAPSVRYRALKFYQKHRVAMTVGTLVFIGLFTTTLISVSAALWAREESRKSSEANEALEIETIRANEALKESQRNAELMRLAKDNAVQNQYVADMKATQVEIDDGNFEAAKRLLDRYRDSSIRGWEWDFLSLRMNGDPHEKLLDFNSRAILLRSISDDGELLLLYELSGRAIVWDWKKQQIIWESKKQNDVAGKSMDMAGNLVALASCPREDGNFNEVWNVRTQSIVWRSSTKSKDVSIAICKSSPWIALSYPEDKVEVINYQTGEMVLSFGFDHLHSESTPFIRAESERTSKPVAFSPDGRYLARGLAWNEHIEIWDLVEKKPIDPPIFIHQEYKDYVQKELWRLSFGSKGERLIVTFLFGDPLIYDLQSKTKTRPFGVEGQNVSSLRESPDGRYFIGGSMDHSIYIWSTQDHRLVKRLRGHTGEVGGAFINRDGDTLISFDNYGEMLKWEWSTSPDEFLGYKANDRLWRNDLGWYISPSDPELIYFNTHPDWEVEGINLAKMKREKTFASHGLEGLSVDGTEMITFRPFGEDREQGEIVRWNLVSETSRAIKIPISREGPQDWPHCQVNYCPEQEEILFSWDSSTFYLLDATTGMIQQSLRPDEKKLFSLINISPQGQWLVLSPEDNIDEGDEVYIFKRVQSQYQLYRVVKLFGNGQVIHTLDFSDDERWLGVLSFEHYGILLDLNEPNNDPIQIGAGKRGIRCIDFAPDGRSVVLGSDDGTLRAWLIETRRELFAIRPGFFIDRVQFSPDDQWLIASGGSKTPYRADRIIRWKIRNGENETAND